MYQTLVCDNVTDLNEEELSYICATKFRLIIKNYFEVSLFLQMTVIPAIWQQSPIWRRGREEGGWREVRLADWFFLSVRYPSSEENCV